MTTATKILLALLGGAVVGATAAMMLTPKSGKELRAEIAAIAREKYQNMNLATLLAVGDGTATMVATVTHLRGVN
jgi:gas vesicle protein